MTVSTNSGIVSVTGTVTSVPFTAQLTCTPANCSANTVDIRTVTAGKICHIVTIQMDGNGAGNELSVKTDGGTYLLKNVAVGATVIPYFVTFPVGLELLVAAGVKIQLVGGVGTTGRCNIYWYETTA
jgi:hypothetical protein